MKAKFLILAAVATAITFTAAGCSQSEAIPPYGDEVVGETPEEQLPENTPDEEEDAPEVEIYKRYVTLTANDVNIRKGAGTSYKVVGAAEKATSYAYLGEEGGFYKVWYKNSIAYISKQYSKLSDMRASEDEEVEAVIYEGTKLLGTTYIYGATRYHDGKGNKLRGFSVSAFDCSSLMQYIFYLGADGVLLGVTTRNQVLQGEAVKKTDLQRGDLMFFTNASRYNKVGVERIGHVALYLGDNLILHTASDYAKIEKISSTRWSYFIEARRMV